MKDFQNIKTITVFLIALCFKLVSFATTTIDPPTEGLKFYNYDFDCDLCGCSTNSGSLGFGTLNNANFVGIRYINQSFESQNGVFVNSPVSKETFNTYQLWAQVPINEAFSVSANLPYQDLNRKVSGEEERINGIGDASLIGWFTLPFYNKNSDESMNNAMKEPTGHTVKFGLGVKLPTGKFEEALADNVNPGFQVGTGSFDGIVAAGYNYAADRIGVNTMLTYYVKGENKNEYQFGNQLSYSANFYTAFPSTKVNIMPFLGFSGDVYNKITQYNETLNDTDGSIFNGSIGTEIILKKCILGFNFTTPLSQDLFGGNVTSKNRVSLYFNYAL